MTIENILRKYQPDVFEKLDNMRKTNTPVFKLDYKSIKREIARRIDLRLRKSETERFITTELTYRQDKGDYRIVRKAGDSIIDAMRVRAPHLLAS